MNINLNIAHFALWYLQNVNLTNPNKDIALARLNKAFPSFSEINEKCINQIIKDLENNPQIIVNTTLASVMDLKQGTTYLTNKHLLSNTPKTLLEQIKTIALFWEISGIYKLATYLLSEGRTPENSLNKPKAIYKSFKAMNIELDVEKIRKIRNAVNHKYSFENDWLLDKDGNKVATYYDIQDIHKKLILVNTWWKFFLTQNILSNPKFAIASIHFPYYEISDNKEEYSKAYQGISQFAPNLFKKKKSPTPIPKPKPKTKTIIDSFRNKIKDALTFRTQVKFQIKVSNNTSTAPTFFNPTPNLKEQLDNLHFYLIQTKDKLTTEKDKNNIQKTIDMLNFKGPHWINQIPLQK